MPWVPTTDFEEEVVNLQPDHDFIYGVLSEPQYTYPRPKSHTEYAASKKTTQSKGQQKQNTSTTTGRINGKLHVIQQVQRMASTKPVGEQPTVDDWENNKKIEQETIGMMRYCGMGVSVEQPLNQKVTIATYPVENTIKVVQNGRRKVALYFDDNVFKLKEKVSDTSSGFESCNNSRSYDNNQNDSIISEQEGDSNTETSFNNSFVSSSSLSVNSFSTAGENSDTLSSISAYNSTPSSQFKAQRLQHYDKLLEDTAALSLSNSSNISSRSCNSSSRPNLESFLTAEEYSSWTPISFEDENILGKQENWPVLCNNNKNKIGVTNTTQYSKTNKPGYYKTSSDSSDEVSSEITTSSSSNCSSNQSKRINFLDRFIKPENCDTLNTSTSSSDSSKTSDMEQKTYANIAKATHTTSSLSKQKNKNNSSDLIRDFQPFYTARKMYALKRHV